MRTYIGIKMVEAIPGKKENVDGYNILYSNGYTSWCPREVFEKTYLPINTKNTICQKDIDQLLADVKTFTADIKTTLARATLLTGFIIYETSSCVNPENYDIEKGTHQAIGKINSKIWFAMGFILQWARYGLKFSPKNKEEVNGNIK